MRFSLRRQVEFNHCDPAGIVYYPRYFEMISALSERFFDALGFSWAQMMERRSGTPLGEITMRFHQPSHLGDLLDLEVAVSRLGAASVELFITAKCAQELRFQGHATLVYVENGAATPWPGALRTALGAHLISTTKTEQETPAS